MRSAREEVRVAVDRLRCVLGLQPPGTNLMDRRAICAHAAYVLEGVVMKDARCPCLDAPDNRTPPSDYAPPHHHTQLEHLTHLLDVTRQYAFEEQLERDLRDLPELRLLTQRNVRTARRLYGPKFVSTSKVHRLLHLYEGDGRAVSRNDRTYADALAYKMPTCLQLAAWTPERLHKRVKQCARKARGEGPRYRAGRGGRSCSSVARGPPAQGKKSEPTPRHSTESARSF